MREVTYNFQQFSPDINRILNAETPSDSQQIAIALSVNISDKRLSRTGGQSAVDRVGSSMGSATMDAPAGCRHSSIAALKSLLCLPVGTNYSW